MGLKCCKCLDDNNHSGTSSTTFHNENTSKEIFLIGDEGLCQDFSTIVVQSLKNLCSVSDFHFGPGNAGHRVALYGQLHPSELYLNDDHCNTTHSSLSTNRQQQKSSSKTKRVSHIDNKKDSIRRDSTIDAAATTNEATPLCSQGHPSDEPTADPNTPSCSSSSTSKRFLRIIDLQLVNVGQDGSSHSSSGLSLARAAICVVDGRRYFQEEEEEQEGKAGNKKQPQKNNTDASLFFQKHTSTASNASASSHLLLPYQAKAEKLLHYVFRRVEAVSKFRGPKNPLPIEIIVFVPASDWVDPEIQEWMETVKIVFEKASRVTSPQATTNYSSNGVAGNKNNKNNKKLDDDDKGQKRSGFNNREEGKNEAGAKALLASAVSQHQHNPEGAQSISSISAPTQHGKKHPSSHATNNDVQSPPQQNSPPIDWTNITLLSPLPLHGKNTKASLQSVQPYFWQECQQVPQRELLRLVLEVANWVEKRKKGEYSLSDKEEEKSKVVSCVVS